LEGANPRWGPDLAEHEQASQRQPGELPAATRRLVAAMTAASHRRPMASSQADRNHRAKLRALRIGWERRGICWDADVARAAEQLARGNGGPAATLLRSRGVL
jgi:hypothetical protein